MGFRFNRIAGILAGDAGAIPLPVQLGANDWYFFLDASKFVEGDTDKVGSWLDGSGNSNTISQITGSRQPGWITPGPTVWDAGDVLDGATAPGTNYTCILRVKVTSSVPAAVILGSGGADINQFISIDTQLNVIVCNTSTTASVVGILGADPLNRDMVVALVKTGTSYQFYVDGAVNGSPFINTGDFSQATAVGGRVQTTAFGHIGDMQHCSTYPSALTAQNISDLTTAINAGDI